MPISARGVRESLEEPRRFAESDESQRALYGLAQWDNQGTCRRAWRIGEAIPVSSPRYTRLHSSPPEPSERIRTSCVTDLLSTMNIPQRCTSR